jgi:hypothetical protein
MTAPELAACRACGAPASRSALTCAKCGAVRPATPAADLAAELAIAKAKTVQTYGALAVFLPLAWVALAGKGADLTVQLLVAAVGVVFVIAGAIDRRTWERRRRAPPA